MKAMSPSLIVAFALLTLIAASARSQTVVTFDDLPNSTTGTFIASPYSGLNWSNFYVVNAAIHANVLGTNGAFYGMVTASNVAFNGFGNPAEIDSPGTNFNFLSAYLTGVWNSNLNIQVEGFNGTNLLYNQTVVASATDPTLFTFNYLDIDRLYFDSYGGEPAFTPVPEYHFAMDNFTFEFVPEPSSLLLATAGALLLWPLLKRKPA